MIVQPVDWAYVYWCSVLFALGGTGEWAWASRAWRYIGIPAITLAVIGLSWWNIAIVSLLGLLLSQGYGESTPYWRKLLVGMSWAVPSILIGWTWWQFVLPMAWMALFVFSNSHGKLAKNLFVWKVVEFAMGNLVAMTFLGVLR